MDASVELVKHGHHVHVFISHHDKNRFFEDTLSGAFLVSVYGSFLPKHIFYRLHAVCAYLRCIFFAPGILLMWPSFDVILADQVSAVIPILKSFAKLYTLKEDLRDGILESASMIIVGGYDSRLRENVECLDELKDVVEKEGVSQRVAFITSCSTAERNTLLSQCLCVIYAPTI
ncbi:hypothetical protein CDL15_Pgr002352 [Punica granatum]|uniref:Uncharacterized protein n=1 Tax=Punica granatum TaxID=22663 RepID=A0A218XTV3_PUNGR|nr:hypothetical protein CDL15_Pgr002352 [Punica granatum]